jgi:hypothetical protein
MDDPSADAAPLEWTVQARNLPIHARNAIHTDRGAQAAGFPRALVAGVTTYAYLTHPIVAAWGTTWLDRGGAEVRFRRPVFDQDLVVCSPATDGADAVLVRAITSAPEQPRAVLRASPVAAPATELRPGTDLRPIEVVLDGEWGAHYGRDAGDDLALYDELGIVHPAVWPALANQVVHTQVAEGSWVHTRSVIRHHGVVHTGRAAIVRARIVDRFESHGQRAVLDVHVEVEGAVVASLEHEAIVRLP